MKTVIFGGTFNPIHIGHIADIKAALKKLKPDRLIVMPTHIPPHKRAAELAPDEARLKMCRIALKDIKGCKVSDYEILKGGKSYTVATVEHFHEENPCDELYFLMGSDMLMTFLDWYMPERIMELATLVCISRSQKDSAAIEKNAEKIRQTGGRVIIIDSDPIEISSTDIRSHIAAYGNGGGLVPKAVEKYIMKNKLYNFDKTKYNNYVAFLKERLSEKRFIHSMNVADESLKLALLNGVDPDRAYFAGLMHDCCKEIPKEEQLSLALKCKFPISEVELSAPKTHHGIAGAVYLEEHFGIKDDEILSAVRYHTVARGGMTMLEKIVYMADLISAERSFEDVETIRSVTREDIDLGMFEALKFSICYSIDHVRAIPASTFEAYNDAVRYKSAKDRA